MLIQIRSSSQSSDASEGTLESGSFEGLIWDFLNWRRNRFNLICILVWICRWCFSRDRFCAKGNYQSLALLGFYFWQWRANETVIIPSLLLTAQRQVSPRLLLEISFEIRKMRCISELLTEHKGCWKWYEIL